ncbi:MAG: sel1 repeat family protein [Alphaproteobacteria bacterium]|nr:sel1 repeat family protein [Alphaproteobacteria bacterium]
MKKILFILGITTCLASQAQAGLIEGVLAYQYKQYPTAFAEFNYLANEGDPAANYYLGKLYQEGLGAPQNEARAFSLFQAADSGYYFPATAELGKMLLNGSAQVPPDPKKAIALLKKATHAGESDAAFMLGQAYAFGTNVEPNLNYAYGYYLLSALSGNMKAQYALAKLYLEGRGVPQDYTEALKWMTRSANQGYVLAQIELADIYMANQRLKNAAKAYSWYSIIAAYNIDEIGRRAKEKRDALEEGLDTKVLAAQQTSVRSWKPIPAEESVSSKEKEETQIPQIPGFNDAQSLQDLLISEGYLPQNGKKYGITTKMVDEAIAYQNADELVRKIDAIGHKGKTTAYGYLGDLYKTRLADLTEAFNWYKKGAEAGDSYAEYQLAKMYCEGQGISQPDAASCYAWLKIAQKEQNPILNGLIQNALNLVEQSATKEELDAGRELMKTLEKSPEEKTEKKANILNFF